MTKKSHLVLWLRLATLVSAVVVATMLAGCGQSAPSAPSTTPQSVDPLALELGVYMSDVSKGVLPTITGTTEEFARSYQVQVLSDRYLRLCRSQEAGWRKVARRLEKATPPDAVSSQHADLIEASRELARAFMSARYTAGNLQVISYTQEEIEQQAGAMSYLMNSAAKTWITTFVDWHDALAREANRLNMPYPPDFSAELAKAKAAIEGP